MSVRLHRTGHCAECRYIELDITEMETLENKYFYVDCKHSNVCHWFKEENKHKIEIVANSDIFER